MYQKEKKIYDVTKFSKTIDPFPIN